MAVSFEPMRSLIYVNVAKEEYRHKMQHWLYKNHITESISQFSPYVTKYAFYNALPIPPDGDHFGTYNCQLTEHYWLLNPMSPELKVKTMKEYMPLDVLKWQGVVPDDDVVPQGFTADDVRGGKIKTELPPFIFAFVPVWWEDDFKGTERTVEDGPNYRWQFLIKYPEGISIKEGDQWLLGEVLPAFVAMPEVTRILTSKVFQSVDGCPFQRLVEMWFDGPTAWHKAAVEKSKTISKPSWAKYDKFPFLKPKFEIAGLFVTDIPTSDNYTQYRGYITMR
jgi:hypothetical protein